MSELHVSKFEVCSFKLTVLKLLAFNAQTSLIDWPAMLWQADRQSDAPRENSISATWHYSPGMLIGQVDKVCVQRNGKRRDAAYQLQRPRIITTAGQI